jgi:hypothetical protein
MHIQLLSIIQLVKTVTRFTQYNTFETAQFYQVNLFLQLYDLPVFIYNFHLKNL